MAIVRNNFDYAKFIILGLPTWTLVDGTWAALSQLAESLPEGYRISSFLMLAFTLGNTCSILFGSFVMKEISFSSLHAIICRILVVGFAAGVCLAALWDVSISIGNQNISLPLYIAFFCVGMCSTTSNVTHMTFVSHWPATNTSWLATGIGLGSTCAGLLALLQALLPQSSGTFLRFSVSLYFAILTMLYVPALFAMQFLKINPSVNNSHLINGLNNSDDEDINILLRKEAPYEDTSPDGGVVPHIRLKPISDLDFICSRYSFLAYLAINAVLGFGLIPSTVSLISGKFSNSKLILLLATSISAIVDPMFKGLTMYISIRNERLFLILVCSLVALSLVQLSFLCVPASSPIFSGNLGLLIVFVYPAINAINVFTTTSILLYFKNTMDEVHIQQCYRLSVVASQSGAVVGTLTAFILIISNAV